MKKASIFIVLFCLLGTVSKAQTMDTVAVSILDRMTALFGDLSSLSASVHADYDVANPELGLIKHTDDAQVFLSGPNKLFIRSTGDKGNKYMVYDGKMLSYYSIDNNHYSQVAVPSTIMGMIDHMNKNYGIVFPMADFLYPEFVNDLLAESNSLILLGTTKINGRECFHIAGSTKEMTYQFWISDDAYFLPMKMVCVYTDKPLHPQYEATYTDWQLNPSIPATIFNFNVPPRAQKIKLHSKTVKK